MSVQPLRRAGVLGATPLGEGGVAKIRKAKFSAGGMLSPTTNH
jgi:hypothetical protein